MISISELERKWESISAYLEGFLLVSDNHPLSFHIGYINREKRCFMVLKTGYVEMVPSSRAITVECVKTFSNEYALRFTLNYPALEELFTKLCWDLIEASEGTSDPLGKLLFQYKSWMKLLQAADIDILTSSSQKGLFGELLYLEKKIPEFGEKEALVAWVGPEGSDQDFVFNDFWSEIKTVKASSSEVSIASMQQLDRENDGLLVVFFIDKTSAESRQTLSLPKLIKRINDILSPELQDVLSCKLAKYGYFAKDAKHYEKTFYFFSEQRTYIVNSSFPKLIRSNIPIEINNLKYELNLSAIDSFRKKEKSDGCL